MNTQRETSRRGGREAAGREDGGDGWGEWRTRRRRYRRMDQGGIEGKRSRAHPAPTRTGKGFQETPWSRPESDAGAARGYQGDTDTDRNEN